MDAGVDIVCAQVSHFEFSIETVELMILKGGEGGGHTGDIPNSILIPAVVDVARHYRPKLLKGQTALVVAAGGIYNGRSLASSLMQGADGVVCFPTFILTQEFRT